MRKISNLLFACIWALLLLAGCAGEEGEPGPSLTGTIYGFVNSIDENSTPASKAGVTVALEGGTTQTVTTDANGRFEFPNVRTGTYNLTYSRSGYATVKRFAVSHVGGDQPTFLGLAAISQVSGTVVVNLTAGIPNSIGVPVAFTLINPNPGNTSYRASFFASSTTGITATTGTLLATYLFNSPGLQNTTISRNTLLNAGFVAGSTVYLVAYGSPVGPTSYVDPATGRFVYPALNPTPSNVVSFTL